ncbi:MAG: gamma-glutamyl-gamma-aminobutyrate hydrolase family protein [Geminicoccaceae bacterium]|nr:gamma-glutamyl-gamma-aminobutyrate hydrolase family protein [Geminicoccaceae bacterium]
MGTRPVIGITLDSEEAGGYSKFPWYALRQNYASSVVAAGGLPMVLPHEAELVDLYLERIDGLIVTGGAFDVDPLLYGSDDRHPSVSLKQKRTAFEWAILQGALRRDVPVLGICGGMQLLNVVLGGTLLQHIPDSVPNCLAHEQPNPRDQAGHEVSVVAESLLDRLVGRRTMSVNSAHHQAADRIGEGVLVSGRAPDGVVEAIEHGGYRFCLGVEWHPEFLIDEGDARILAGLVRAAQR